MDGVASIIRTDRQDLCHRLERAEASRLFLSGMQLCLPLGVTFVYVYVPDTGAKTGERTVVGRRRTGAMAAM